MNRLSPQSKAAALLLGALVLAPPAARAIDISYRSFSGSATMGPQAEAFAAKLDGMTRLTLGADGAVHFVKLPGIPAIPAQFGGSIVKAVGAGAAGGGFDAAYNSGSELNKTWGFLYNSAFPFGPNFDEFLGFLYGRSVDGAATGLELLQSTLDLRSQNIVAIPIVGSSEQLSGYFSKPLSDVPGVKGIGLAGLCQQPWTFRYLPPGEYVLGRACDNLVRSGAIPAKNIKFIAAIPGGGSLVDAVKLGQLQAFEFATPLDDVSQLFNGVDNPGTVGVRYVHLPGWQQQFLITWLLVNKTVWSALTPAQQALTYGVARDHVLDSYGENMRRQGDAFATILNANRSDADPTNDMVLARWPEEDQERMSIASNQVLNDRISDATLPAADREDLKTILEALRKYVYANDPYWRRRGVEPRMRFDGWTSPTGEPWTSSVKHH
jgi:TRAP-type mannitol/chloroaromatic compound transport system substrate-binding protein